MHSLLEVSYINLRVDLWRAKIDSPQSNTRAENAEMRNLKFGGRVVYPKRRLLNNGLDVLKLEVEVAVLRTPVSYGDGRQQDLSEQCGELSFSEGFTNSDTGEVTPPFLHGWICFDPPEFDDLWLRLRAGQTPSSHVSLTVVGITRGRAPDSSDEQWNVAETPSLKVVEASMSFTYEPPHEKDYTSN